MLAKTTLIITIIKWNYIVIGDPVTVTVPFVILGALIVLCICWIILRMCWKRQCCCPGIWRRNFWLFVFCLDCGTYDAKGINIDKLWYLLCQLTFTEKEGNALRMKNPGGRRELLLLSDFYLIFLHRVSILSSWQLS